jgi:hypothetical protein
MTLLNLFIAGMLAWLLYKLVCMAIEAIKLAIKQADDLEQQFGPDVIGAAKYMLLGPDNSPASSDGGPNKRMYDDG